MIFTREKLIDNGGCVSLTLLLDNCYDVTGGIFDRWISAKQVWKVLLNGPTIQEKNDGESLIEIIG